MAELGFTLLLAISLLFYALYCFIKKNSLYWQKKKVPHIEPTFLFGNYAGCITLKEYLGHRTQKICQRFPDCPYVGSYYGTEPTLIVKDPDHIKLVMTKDFYYFSSREISKYCHKEVVTQNLFFTYGDRWKVVRQNLTPLFSSAKMRNMFHLIENCAHVFEKMLDDETDASEILEARSLVARYTMDCIGSCAFGVDTNTMQKDQGNPFRTIGTMIFGSTTYRGLKSVGRAIWPSIFYGLGLKSFPTAIDEFFSRLLMGVFEARQYTPTNRNDFIDLLLNLKKSDYIVGDSLTNAKTGEGKKVQLELNDELLIAQCIVFFAAGYETSATTLSFTLYELAKNEEAQTRAQQEIDAYLLRNNNKLGYNCVTELPYVEACIDEALRLYPLLGVITREVVEDYTFPDGLEIDKGIRIHIPAAYLHYNPEFFPEPEEFRPERFLAEAKKNIKPYTYMPFGEGPRVCIGMRFAKMQMLAGLVTLLKKYRVELAPDMPRTLELEPRVIVTQPIGGIRLKFTERDGWNQRLLA